MIRLDSTMTLQAVLGGAIATTQPQATASFSDKSASGYAGGSQRTALNSTTDVNIVNAPAALTIRDIDYLSIYNCDTASIVVTVKYDISATDSIIITVTLLTLETLIYTHAAGWMVMTATGGIKTPGGTVTSVALTVPSEFSVAGSPITTAGTLAITRSLAALQDFRLTLASDLPVTTADQLAKTTIYATSYRGKQIALYDGSAIWNVRSSAEMSIAVPATTDTMYDVFCYDNAGVPTLELTAWTNDTTRATALAYQDGILVKSGATTRRYLGSIRTTSVSGEVEDSAAKRYVWNYYNRVLRSLVSATETTNTWNYTTATFRQANANTANQLDFIIGVIEDTVSAKVLASCSNSLAPLTVSIGIGLDSTTTNSAQIMAPASTDNIAVRLLFAEYLGFPGLGRHFLPWLEYSSAVGTTTWNGDGGIPAFVQSGMIGSLMG